MKIYFLALLRHEVWPNVVIAFCTVVIAILTYETMKISQSQLEALSLTREQIRLSRVQISPFISIEKITTSDKSATLNFKNSGTTPAQEFIVVGRQFITDEAYLKNTDKDDLGDDYNDGYEVNNLAPSGSIDLTLSKMNEKDVRLGGKNIDDFTAEDLAALGLNKIMIVNGKILYKDIFGNLYHQNFCYYYGNDRAKFRHVCRVGKPRTISTLLN